MAHDTLKVVSTAKAHGGMQGVYTTWSDACACEMTFAVFVPPQALERPCPVLWYLSGLTCTHQNVMDKGEYRKRAAELGLIIVCPDTSPRGDQVPDDATNWQFGKGAGFYLDAAEEPWNVNYNMKTHILEELPALIADNFPADMSRQSVFGHSMGGHGALSIALKNPGMFASASAFSPITNPVNCPWGQKAFTAYLGDDKSAWEAHDTVCLINASKAHTPMLVDQGLDDNFLAEQLKPEALQHAAEANQYPLTLRQHEGYDHSYYFIASFIEEHLRFHKKYL